MIIEMNSFVQVTLWTLLIFSYQSRIGGQPTSCPSSQTNTQTCPCSDIANIVDEVKLNVDKVTDKVDKVTDKVDKVADKVDELTRIVSEIVRSVGGLNKNSSELSKNLTEFSTIVTTTSATSGMNLLAV